MTYQYETINYIDEALVLPDVCKLLSSEQMKEIFIDEEQISLLEWYLDYLMFNYNYYKLFKRQLHSSEKIYLDIAENEIKRLGCVIIKGKDRYRYKINNTIDNIVKRLK